jgi:hypothetical protein
MFLLYIVAALFILFILYKIYLNYKYSFDKMRFFKDIAIFFILLLLTYLTKIMLVYKPLLIFHLIFLIVAYRYFYLYLFKNYRFSYWIVSALITITLFILISFYAREYA